MTQPLTGQLTGNKRILIVEDEYFLAAHLRSVLEQAGYDILASVGEVQEALEILKHEWPDAAVLDVHLSDGNVTPVAAVLKATGVPFVLASALTTKEIRETPFSGARPVWQANGCSKTARSNSGAAAKLAVARMSPHTGWRLQEGELYGPGND